MKYGSGGEAIAMVIWVMGEDNGTIMAIGVGGWVVGMSAMVMRGVGCDEWECNGVECDGVGCDEL